MIELFIDVLADRYTLNCLVRTAVPYAYILYDRRAQYSIGKRQRV